MEDKNYTIHYEFWFGEHDKEDFKIAINPKTITMASPELKSKPAWARLEYKKCECCTLTEDKHLYCPLAINIASIIDAFQNRVSFEKCLVKCIKSTLI